jgi:DNA-binding helix-hairpin-helix protein with protein kinase domain
MAIFTGTSGKMYFTPAQPFAGGGEGDIYEITGNVEIAAKIYKSERRSTEKERKLLAMTEIKPDMLDQYAWPMEVLYEEGLFVGYLMPRIYNREKLRNIYVYDKRGGSPWPLYVAIAKNLSAAVHNVHEIGQCIGDLNPENILVDPGTGLVTLVDADSCHITDAAGNVYRCEVGMPEFVAPELQGKHFPSEPLPTFTQETDRFSLSVLIFSLLMNGAHPFACKTISGSSSKFQPIDNLLTGTTAYFTESSNANIDIPKYSPELSSLPLDIQSLFQRAFVGGHSRPEFRPKAEEWFHALDRLEKSIKSCEKNPAHLYYSYAKECPWCAVEEKMKSVSGAISFSEHFLRLISALHRVQKMKNPGASSWVSKISP